MKIKIVLLMISVILICGCSDFNTSIMTSAPEENKPLFKDTVYFTMYHRPSELNKKLFNQMKRLLENEGFAFVDDSLTAKRILEFRSYDSLTGNHMVYLNDTFYDTFGRAWVQKSSPTYIKRIKENQASISLSYLDITPGPENPRGIRSLWYGYMITDAESIKNHLPEVVKQLMKYFGKKQRMTYTFTPKK